MQHTKWNILWNAETFMQNHMGKLTYVFLDIPLSKKNKGTN